MPLSTLLEQPTLTIIAGSVDSELTRIRDVIEHKLMADGRGDLETQLSRLLMVANPETVRPKTLDLIGHSIPGTAALRLGDWIIDVAKPGVTAFFRGLAEHDVLPRLGVHAVRLLGCRTAETTHARRTILTVSEILGLEVWGTTGIIFAKHYNAAGFDPAWRFLLASSSDLRHVSPGSNGAETSFPKAPRSLDLDSLPATPIGAAPRWPCYVADESSARSLLRLIRRHEGAWMPGLLVMPRCEVLIAARAPNTFHRIQLVLDGDFIRVYPDGPMDPAVLYPVSDPHALGAIVDRLPVLGARAHDDELQRKPWA